MESSYYPYNAKWVMYGLSFGFQKRYQQSFCQYIKSGRVIIFISVLFFMLLKVRTSWQNFLYTCSMVI